MLRRLLSQICPSPNLYSKMLYFSQNHNFSLCYSTFVCCLDKLASVNAPAWCQVGCWIYWKICRLEKMLLLYSFLLNHSLSVVAICYSFGSTNTCFVPTFCYRMLIFISVFLFAPILFRKTSAPVYLCVCTTHLQSHLGRRYAPTLKLQTYVCRLDGPCIIYLMHLDDEIRWPWCAFYNIHPSRESFTASLREKDTVL